MTINDNNIRKKTYWKVQVRSTVCLDFVPAIYESELSLVAGTNSKRTSVDVQHLPKRKKSFGQKKADARKAIRARLF